MSSRLLEQNRLVSGHIYLTLFAHVTQICLYIHLRALSDGWNPSPRSVLLPAVETLVSAAEHGGSNNFGKFIN
jgi:hypothetical protein